MRPLRLGLFIAAAAAILLLALLAGPRFIDPLAMNDTERGILYSLRLPRVIVALLMGMALGASGAVLQGVLRNPLADPYILGISSGASLTAALGILDDADREPVLDRAAGVHKLGFAEYLAP